MHPACGLCRQCVVHCRKRTARPLHLGRGQITALLANVAGHACPCGFSGFQVFRGVRFLGVFRCFGACGMSRSSGTHTPKT